MTNNTPDYEDNLYFPEKLQNSEDVANNVTNENSQHLNKQWYDGALQKDKYYYAKDSSEGDCIVYINKSNELTFTGWEVPYLPEQSDRLESFKLRTELLVEVPSYDELKQLKEQIEHANRLIKWVRHSSWSCDQQEDDFDRYVKKWGVE